MEHDINVNIWVEEKDLKLDKGPSVYKIFTGQFLFSEEDTKKYKRYKIDHSLYLDDCIEDATPMETPQDVASAILNAMQDVYKIPKEEMGNATTRVNLFSQSNVSEFQVEKIGDVSGDDIQKVRKPNEKESNEILEALYNQLSTYSSKEVK